MALLKIAGSPSTRSRPVGAVHPCKNLDECRLPRAVLADEPVCLAGVEGDVSFLERVDGAEALLRVLEDEQRFGRSPHAQSRWKTS